MQIAIRIANIHRKRRDQRRRLDRLLAVLLLPLTSGGEEVPLSGLALVEESPFFTVLPDDRADFPDFFRFRDSGSSFNAGQSPSRYFSMQLASS